ncbi:MAG: hypothetical protein EAZ87_08210 [Nostocales cyanobacterium]|nr:MAG: hypothetical protein EAZ87_08210 [Nostocales cyanobacterium]
MAQNSHLQQLHFASRIEVFEQPGITKVKVELRRVHLEYLIPTDIAIRLNGGSTRGKWTSQRVNQKLAKMGYQTKPYGEWQYTDIGKQFACFDRKEGLKWHSKVIDLIIEDDSPFQQLSLAV